jgi:hypothetical protein
MSPAVSAARGPSTLARYRPVTTTLDPQLRGDEFRYTFTLGNSWVASMFTGGLLWTLRSSIPASTVLTDADAVDQAELGDEITFSSTTVGTILIPGARTKLWPARRLFWDLQGVVTVGARVLTIDRGEIQIVGDVTRSQ